MTQEDREILRRTVLEVLARTAPVPRTATGLKRAVEVELPFGVSLQDMEAALEFHRGNSHATFEHDPHGATKWWRATSVGILAVERGR